MLVRFYHSKFATGIHHMTLEHHCQFPLHSDFSACTISVREKFSTWATSCGKLPTCGKFSCGEFTVVILSPPMLVRNYHSKFATGIHHMTLEHHCQFPLHNDFSACTISVREKFSTWATSCGRVPTCGKFSCGKFTVIILSPPMLVRFYHSKFATGIHHMTLEDHC